MTIRRHAARPHRVRGQHRAARTGAPLSRGPQLRYTAVVGSAVAGASVVALAAAAALPSEEPNPAASQAVADIAAHAHQSEAPGPAGRTGARPADARPAEAGSPERSGARATAQTSPLAVQEPQILWSPMLDRISVTSLFGPRWGRNHNGIDLAAATGTPVYAASSGTVARAGWESGFGNLVVIDHGDGVTTYYAHNSEIFVAESQWVDAGDHISAAGDTGYSFGSHLHFEVRVDGEPVEPLAYLESAGMPLL